MQYAKISNSIPPYIGKGILFYIQPQQIKPHTSFVSGTNDGFGLLDVDKNCCLPFGRWKRVVADSVISQVQAMHLFESLKQLLKFYCLVLPSAGQGTSDQSDHQLVQCLTFAAPKPSGPSYQGLSDNLSILRLCPLRS